MMGVHVYAAEIYLTTDVSECELLRGVGITLEEEIFIKNDGSNTNELCTAFSISYGSYHSIVRLIEDTLEDYTNNIEDLNILPFYQNISNHSDCGGGIGPSTCKELSDMFTDRVMAFIESEIRKNLTYDDGSGGEEFHGEFELGCIFGFVKVIKAAAAANAYVIYS